MIFNHEPVLIEETISGMNIKPDGIYVDGTIGGGGHSFRIAQKLTTGRLIGIDQDSEAVNEAKKRLSVFGNAATVIHDNFSNICSVLKDLEIDRVDGILLDIGVSSYQIDNPERGFSYRYNAPLDMRMNPEQSLTARDIVNTYTKEELSRIIRQYGEDNFAGNIAKHIVNEREKSPIESTGQLVKIVEHAIPQAVRKNNEGAAKRTFQALRIEVNSELDVLRQSIEPMINLLNHDGRLAIITFHSLEDRIVKNEFKRCENPCICPPDFPFCVCGKTSLGKVVTKHPITASPAELEKNKRSSSAKLRIFKKE